MRRTINQYNTAFRLICLYPLVNISVAYFFNKQGLRTTYIVFSLIILILLGIKKKLSSTINTNYFAFVIASVVAIVLSYLNNPSSQSILNGLVFLIFLLFLYTYSVEEIIKRFEKYSIRNRRYFIYVEIIYLIVLLISCVYGDGIDMKGWNTTSLKGPYEINHLLAYEILVFSAYSLKKWYICKSKFYFVNSIVLALLVFMTGVRSALLALAILVFYYLIKMNYNRRIIVCVLGLFVIAIVATTTNVFDVVLSKTRISIERGSISSSRPLIFASSLKAYFNTWNSFFDYLFGIGLDRLTLFNSKSIHMAIHAHNDFIDALAIFGLTGFALYMYGVIRLFSRNRKKWLVLFYFILAFFNGFYQYQFIVIGLPILLISFDIHKNNRKENFLA